MKIPHVRLLFAVLALILIVAATGILSQDVSPTDANKETAIRLFEEVLNADTVPSESIIGEFYAENTIHHAPNSVDLATRGRLSGRTSLRDWRLGLNLLRTAFPDYEITVQHVIADEDMVVVHYEFRGTQEANYRSWRNIVVSPSEDGDNLVVWVGVYIMRFQEDGKIKELWEYWDNEALAVAEYLGPRRKP